MHNQYARYKRLTLPGTDQKLVLFDQSLFDDQFLGFFLSSKVQTSHFKITVLFDGLSHFLKNACVLS